MLSRDDRFDSEKSGSSIARVALSIPASETTMESLNGPTCKFITTCNELCTWPAISYFPRGRKISRSITRARSLQTMSLVIIIAISLSPSYTLECIAQMFFAIIGYFISAYTS